MKHTTTIICCLLSIAVAASEKQIRLEDIERENLANERKTKLEKELGPSQFAPQKGIIPSQIQYGFKPLRAPHEYIKPQTQQQYVPQTEIVQYANPSQQYATQLSYPQQTQFIDPKTYTQYQQYENVPYVTDNQVTQSTQSSPQQYSQQYVYLQPFSSSSNNIQMVIDPKGNIKYYMYVPAQYVNAGKDEPNADLLSQFNNVGPQIFTQEPDYTQQAGGTAQYITQPQLPPQPQIEQVPQTPSSQQVQYVKQTVQEPLPKNQYTLNRQPQSLLDSYVPSLVQFQFYKQQAQANANTIPRTLTKPTLSKQPIYVPSSSSEYSFQIPTAYNTRRSNQ